LYEAGATFGWGEVFRFHHLDETPQFGVATPFGFDLEQASSVGDIF